MEYLRRASLLALLAVLAACATTVSEKDCRAVDWHSLGQADGAKGDASAQFGTHMPDCNRYGIAEDAKAYRAGREQGLLQFCNIENALNYGISGAPYKQVCPGADGERFTQLYNRGFALYTVKDDMKAVQDRENAERAAEKDLKDPELQRQLQENVSYLEREKQFIQRQYELSVRAVRSGFDPPFYDAGGWVSGIPNPKAATRAAKAR